MCLFYDFITVTAFELLIACVFKDYMYISSKDRFHKAKLFIFYLSYKNKVLYHLHIVSFIFLYLIENGQQHLQLNYKCNKWSA